jgi:hypothetical protein
MTLQIIKDAELVAGWDEIISHIAEISFYSTGKAMDSRTI